ncbi:MAG: exo-alpha-sialidase, partial [Actinomycetota bacterium]|nr:exo-alpha-sialidase [Actinomycetota bacterium]
MKRRLTAVALIAALAGCGGGDDGDGDDGPAPREELHHIHGLGVDARSGDLFIATHNGLFVAPAGRTSVRRVGDSRQDIMGFSVAGPRRFVGSGHPAPGAQLTPNLGLIESVDGGRTWRNVSLLGEADFHVLRSAGRTVYGVDSATGRLMASRDA